MHIALGRIMSVLAVLSKQALKAFKNIRPGHLIAMDWSDASARKSSSSGTTVDVPVKTREIFVSLIADMIKHIVSTQNDFRYSDGQLDPDNAATPGRPK